MRPTHAATRKWRDDDWRWGTPPGWLVWPEARHECRSGERCVAPGVDPQDIDHTRGMDIVGYAVDTSGVSHIDHRYKAGKDMGKTIPVTVLRGTPYEMGQQHGRAWGPVIRQIARENIESILYLAKARQVPALTETSIHSHLSAYSTYIEEHIPDLFEEAQGIAAGAAVPFDDILGLNAFLDLFDLTFPASAYTALYAGGCTAFGVQGPRSAWAYVGQNYDVRQFFHPGVFLMDLRPTNGPRQLVPTIAGMVGCAGLNECGIAVAINNLTPQDPRPGVPHQFIVRHILAQQRNGDAANAVTSVPRASGFNYLIGDKSGEIIGLETSATKYSVYFPEVDGSVCHCNHYVTASLLHQEGTPCTNGDSIARYGRARHRLRDIDHTHPLDDLMSLCADHTNYPFSICRHPMEGLPPMTQGTTVFSIVVDLPAMELYVTAGTPCANEYQRFALEPTGFVTVNRAESTMAASTTPA